jgi:hypothetical protein
MSYFSGLLSDFWDLVRPYVWFAGGVVAFIGGLVVWGVLGRRAEKKRKRV